MGSVIELHFAAYAAGKKWRRAQAVSCPHLAPASNHAATASEAPLSSARHLLEPVSRLFSSAATKMKHS